MPEEKPESMIHSYESKLDEIPATLGLVIVIGYPIQGNLQSNTRNIDVFREM